MAKSKGGFKPEDLKKHYFWIVLPILVILLLVFAFLAKSSIKKAYVEKTTAIKTAKEGADSVASNTKHPNDDTIKAIKAETQVLADNVFAAWTLMYNDQKMRNRWPRQLSREFLDLVENKLKFRDPIGVGKPYLLEDYGYFITRHLPDLLKEINRRRCQVQEYKLLKKAELRALNAANQEEERFWPVYTTTDAEGREILYVGVHSNKDDEESPLAAAYLINLETDVVSQIEDQTLLDSILNKTEHEHYYRDVDPWILDPKGMTVYDVQASDLQSIVQSIAAIAAGGEGGSGGMMGGVGMSGGMAGSGGGMGMRGGSGSGSGSGSGARGGMSGMDGMGGGLSGLGIGQIPGDGTDLAYEQVSGTSLEELGGGVGGMNGGGRMGAGGAMGGARMGGARMGGSGGMGSGGGRTGGARMGGAMAGSGGMGSGGMGGGAEGTVEDPTWSQKIFPGLPTYKQRRRIVGNVDWPEPEVYSLPTWESTAPHPESIEVWYAQETLWVYEALIRVIAEANKEYPDNIGKAPIKCVEQMLIGQNAAIEWTTLSTTIGDLTGKSMLSSMGSGMEASSSEMMSAGSMGGSESAISLGSTAEEQALTKILLGRYIGDENKPLMPEDKPPFAEFNKMPVCLKLAMDQRRIPNLLECCANSSMPIDVKHVRVCPDNNIPFVMPLPVSDAAGEGGAGGGMGMMAGGLGMMGMSGSSGSPGSGGTGGGGTARNGGRGSAGGMSGGAGAGPGGMSGGLGGSGSGSGMEGSGNVQVGRSELSQSEYGPDTIRVEIYGVINIFNEPNKANFATGAAADEANAESEKILSGGTEGEEGAESGENGASASGASTAGAAVTVSDEAVNAANAATEAANAAAQTADEGATTTPEPAPADATETPTE